MLLIIISAALFSGFRGGYYSAEHVQWGAPPLVLTLLLGWFGGTLLALPLLDWLPGRSYAVKGWLAGFLALAIWPGACLPLHVEPLDVAMAILIIPATTSLLASWLGLASAADWRRSAPLQVAPVAFAAGIWIMARFI